MHVDDGERRLQIGKGRLIPYRSRFLQSGTLDVAQTQQWRDAEAWLSKQKGSADPRDPNDADILRIMCFTMAGGNWKIAKEVRRIFPKLRKDENESLAQLLYELAKAADSKLPVQDPQLQRRFEEWFDDVRVPDEYSSRDWSISKPIARLELAIINDRWFVHPGGPVALDRIVESVTRKKKAWQ